MMFSKHILLLYTLLSVEIYLVTSQTYTILSGSPKSQAAASFDCSATYGANLVSITDANVQTEVADLMSSNGVTSAWAGATRQDTFPYEWQYISDMSYSSDQGCYEDGSPRDFSSEVTSVISGGITIDSCKARCQQDGYAYAALQGGNRCFCDDTYGAYGTTVGCDLICEGDSTQRCGGINKNRVFKISGEYSNWELNKPNSYPVGSPTAYQACVVLHHAYGYRYDDEDCENNAYYICQLPATNFVECNNQFDNEGYLSYITSVCYYISNVQKTWFEARESCLAKGGDLLKLSNRVMFDDILSLTEGDGRWTVGKYWIGLTDRIWSWPNGETLGYSNWENTHPGDVTYTCLKVVRSGNNYLWQNALCSEQLDYICQSGNNVTPSPTPAPTNAPPNNPPSNHPTITATNSPPPPPTNPPTNPQTNPPSNGPQVTTTPTKSSVTDAQTDATGAATNANTNPPNAGAATADGDLSTVEIVLIIIIIVLIGIVIAVIIVLCVWKRGDSANQIGDSKTEVYDGRHLATVPGPVKIDADSYYSDTGSQAGLIPAKNARARPNYDRREYARPDYNVSVGDNP